MIRRILMTADTVGGVWTYAIELCSALESHGVEVALATMGNALDRSQALEAARIPGLQVYESTWRLEWMQDPWNDVDEAGEWLLDLERQTSPDAVHLNGYCHGSLPFAAPVLIVGHPFARAIALDPQVEQTLLARGEKAPGYAIVDEGPGLSGSSF